MADGVNSRFTPATLGDGALIRSVFNLKKASGELVSRARYRFAMIAEVSPDGAVRAVRWRGKYIARDRLHTLWLIHPAAGFDPAALVNDLPGLWKSYGAARGAALAWKARRA